MYEDKNECIYMHMHIYLRIRECMYICMGSVNEHLRKYMHACMYVYYRNLHIEYIKISKNILNKPCSPYIQENEMLTILSLEVLFEPEQQGGNE